MTPTPPPLVPAPAKHRSWIHDSISLRLGIIAGLVLVLLIPTSMIRQIINERESRQSGVVSEISGKWGNPKTLAGPVLTLPAKEYRKTQAGKAETLRYLHILPDTLDITGNLDSQIRYRGIYEAVVFASDVTVTGRFLLPDLERLGVNPKQVQWQDAFLSIGLSDLRGIRDNVVIRAGDQSVSMSPGLNSRDMLHTGMTAPIHLDRKHPDFSFSTTLRVNGSGNFSLVPLGKTTTVQLLSPWTSPSFDGAYLPAERAITSSGFTAGWKILHLNRNYPQYWFGEQHEVMSSAFGVSLVMPADAYQKAERTAKYAILFIGLTFTAFFLCEILNRLRIHPVQYLLVGLALVIFYMLQVSLAEHVGFDRSYGIASLATILLITCYARSVFRDCRRLATMAFWLLACLYAYLYGVIRNEDYALLLGSVGIFLILAAVMYVTRKINWYQSPDSTPTRPVE